MRNPIFKPVYNPGNDGCSSRLGRQERWKLPDAIQAAFCQIYQLTLVTRNFRDFPPDRYDFVVIPYGLNKDKE